MKKSVIAIAVLVGMSGSAVAANDVTPNWVNKQIDGKIADATSSMWADINGTLDNYATNERVDGVKLTADRAYDMAGYAQHAAYELSESMIRVREQLVTKIDTDVGQVAFGVEQNSGEINGIKHRVDALEGDVKNTSETVAGLTGDVTKLQTTATATDARLTQTEATAVAAQNTANSALAAAGNAQLTADKAVTAAGNAQATADANKQAIDQLNPKMEAMINMSSKLALTAASHDSRLSTVEGDIAKTNTRLDVTDRKVDGAMGTAQEAVDLAGKAQATADANTAKITDTQVAVTGNAQAINKLDTKVEWANKEIATLTNDTNGIKHRVEDLENGLESVNKDVAGIAGKVEGNTTEIGKIKDALTAAGESTGKALDEIKTEISGVAGATAAAQGAADKAQGTATEALDKANAAQTSANKAQGTANSALDKAEKAQDTADHAYNISSKNVAAIEEANGRISAVGDIAYDARETANSAVSKADAAQKTADSAVTAAGNAQATADANTAAIKETNSRVDAVDEKATNAGTAASKAQTSADAAQTTANTNATAIRATNTVVASNTNRIDKHEKRLDAVESTVSEHGNRLDAIEGEMKQFKADLRHLKKEVSNVGAMSAATANLHFVDVYNSYAMSIGQYKDSTAIAAGVQFQINNDHAASVQAATTFDSVSVSVGVHGRW